MRSVEATALVGTGRRAPGPVPPIGIAPVDDGDPQTQLLDQAAVLDVLTRAAATPDRREPEAPCPPQARPAAPPEAEQLLRLLIHQPPLKGNERLRAIEHWLTRCAGSGYSVPVALLPDLLTLARQDSVLRPALRASWDQRGAWLASRFEPTLVDPGSGPDGDLDVDGWRKLSAKEATSRLTELRDVDAAAGLARLVELWPGYSAKERGQVIDALGTGLSLDDASFLEAALDDKGKATREAAARLLARLPGSGLVSRMSARLRSLIDVTEVPRGRGLGRLLGRTSTVVRVVPPAEVDAAGVRDGLRPQPTDPDRRHWLCQILEAADPRTLNEVSGLPPQELVEALELDEEVAAALATAVARHADREWAAALLPHPSLRNGRDLALLLDPAQRDAWLIGLIRTAPPAEAAHALLNVPRPWVKPVAAVVIDRLISDKDRGHFLLGVASMPDGFGPDALPLLAALPADLPADLGGITLRAARQFLIFNQTIDEAFASTQPPHLQEEHA